MFILEVILIGDLAKVAEFYKALGDETRLTIVEMLGDREMCVCEIIDKLGMSQPAISHHLKVLKHAGIVKDSREGKWIYYSLNEAVFELVFVGTNKEIIRTYSEPIRQKLSQLQPSQIRTNPALCEKLMCKEK